MKAAVSKWLKRLGLALAAMFALACLCAWWLLGSESGARFALERAKSALAGKLELALAHGVLAGPLELHDIRYRDPVAGVDVRIQSIKVDYVPSHLFARTLHIATLDIDGVEVALTTVASTAPAVSPPSLQSLLTPPLAILLDHAHVGRLGVTQDGRPVFASDSLDLWASWTNAALTIRQLALRAPDGKVDLDGALTSYRDLQGTAKLAFDWRLPGQRVAGNADVHNDGKLTTLAAHLNQPLIAAFDADVTAGDDALPWKLNLDVPAFNPAKLVHDETLKTLALKLQGSGDRTHGRLSGNVDLNAHRVLLDPLQFSLAGKTLSLDHTDCTRPEAPARCGPRPPCNRRRRFPAKHRWMERGGLPATRRAGAGDMQPAAAARKVRSAGRVWLATRQLANMGWIARHTAAIAAETHAKQPKGGLMCTATSSARNWMGSAKADKFDPGAFAATGWRRGFTCSGERWKDAGLAPAAAAVRRHAPTRRRHADCTCAAARSRARYAQVRQQFGRARSGDRTDAATNPPQRQPSQGDG